MLLSSSFKKILPSTIAFIIISGCAPLVPDNYLSPTTIRMAHKTNGHWIEPRFIPISVKMLNTPEGQLLLKPALEPKPYRIGPYDNLNIIVWGHPEISTVGSSLSALPTPTSGVVGVGNALSSVLNNGSTNPTVLVQTDGSIFYPYIGHLKIAGLTIEEAQSKITKKLSLYIRNPQVTVQVAKFRNRNVYVLGEVKGAGMQPLTDKPLTLMEALSSAGGIDPRSADPSHIYVIRGNYDNPDVFCLNSQSSQALLIAEKFPLQENDIVYVSAATLNSWNNFVSTVLPNFTTYYTIKGLS